MMGTFPEGLPFPSAMSRTPEAQAQLRGVSLPASGYALGGLVLRAPSLEEQFTHSCVRSLIHWVLPELLQEQRQESQNSLPTGAHRPGSLRLRRAHCLSGRSP